MPSLHDAINTDRSNLTPVEPSTIPAGNPPPIDTSKVNSLLKNANQRCPLPPSNNSADSLRQWGQGDPVPSFRTQTPPSNVVGGATSATTSVEVVGGASSSTSTTTTSLAKAQNVSLTTPPLAPSQTWTGTIQIAKSFTMLRVSANSYCRTELYGTASGQTLDLSRPVTQAPVNTTQSLIMDVVLLTALSWQVLDCVGSNGDNPQTSTIYVTITNLSTAVQAFTVSMQFVPSES